MTSYNQNSEFSSIQTEEGFCSSCLEDILNDFQQSTHSWLSIGNYNSLRNDSIDYRYKIAFLIGLRAPQAKAAILESLGTERHLQLTRIALRVYLNKEFIPPRGFSNLRWARTRYEELQEEYKYLNRLNESLINGNI